jgi:homoserine kinase
MSSKQIYIEVPGSTANLGPGFDCLGLGLALYHRLKVAEIEGAGLAIEASGEGAEVVPLDESNAIYQAMDQVFVNSGYQPGRLYLESHNEIPLAAGLGSSAAAYVAGLAAGMLLSGRELDPEYLIGMGTAEEGHADNVVACVLGGFTVVGGAGTRLDYVRLEPPGELRVVVVVPDFLLPTQKARSVLPGQVPFRDAILNQGRVGLLTAAMASGRLEVLRSAMEDVLHQSYRAELIPGLEEVRQAALEIGALGTALSGAGPTVLALVRQGDAGVGAAMQRAWRRKGIESRSMVLEVDRSGLRAAIE